MACQPLFWILQISSGSGTSLWHPWTSSCWIPSNGCPPRIHLVLVNITELDRCNCQVPSHFLLPKYRLKIFNDICRIPNLFWSIHTALFWWTPSQVPGPQLCRSAKLNSSALRTASWENPDPGSSHSLGNLLSQPETLVTLWRIGVRPLEHSVSWEKKNSH